MYKKLYRAKWDGIDINQTTIKNGLDKLLEATEGVNHMKVKLQQEDLKLQKSSEETNALIEVLSRENEAAERKTIEVDATKNSCIAKKAQIEIEKEEADKDLKKAMPF